MTATDRLLLLLYTMAHIDTATRLQKLVFLLQQNIGASQGYQFAIGQMGPYSERLRSDLDELESADIVIATRLPTPLPDDRDDVPEQPPDYETGPKSKRFQSWSYTLPAGLGQRIGADLWSNLAKKDRKQLTAFAEFPGSLPLRLLLRHTYDTFPEFTERDEISRILRMKT